MCNYNSVKTSLVFFIFFDHSSSFKWVPFEMNNKKNIKSNRCNIFFLILALLCFPFFLYCCSKLFFAFLLLFVLSIHSASIYFIFVTQTAYRIVHICTTNAIISEIHCIFCISFIIFFCASLRYKTLAVCPVYEKKQNYCSHSDSTQ